MSLRTRPENTAWISDDTADYTGLDMNAEIFDTVDACDGELELEVNEVPRPKYFTALQRIEMFREEAWLRSLVADFEDFDLIDNIDEHHSSVLSH